MSQVQNCYLHIDGTKSHEDQQAVWDLLNKYPCFTDESLCSDNKSFIMSKRDRYDTFCEVSHECPDLTFMITCDDGDGDSDAEFHDLYGEYLFKDGLEKVLSSHKRIEYYKGGDMYEENVWFVSSKFDEGRLKG